MSALGIKSSDTLRTLYLAFFQLLFAPKIDEFCLVRVHLKAHRVHPRLNLKHTALKGCVCFSLIVAGVSHESSSNTVIVCKNRLMLSP